MKLEFLALVLSLLCLSGMGMAAARALKPVDDNDPYVKVVDPNDPYIKGLGAFAVTEHNNQAKTDLKFQNVIQGYFTEDEVGWTYYLFLAAKDGETVNKYDVDVWVKKNSTYKSIMFFTLIKD